MFYLSLLTFSIGHFRNKRLFLFINNVWWNILTNGSEIGLSSASQKSTCLLKKFINSPLAPPVLTNSLKTFVTPMVFSFAVIIVETLDSFNQTEKFQYFSSEEKVTFVNTSFRPFWPHIEPTASKSSEYCKRCIMIIDWSYTGCV